MSGAILILPGLPAWPLFAAFVIGVVAGVVLLSVLNWLGGIR